MGNEPKLPIGQLQRTTITEDKILANIWQRIFSSFQFTELEFTRMLNDYLEDPRNLDSAEKISSARASIVRQLNAPTMSWKTFMRGLKIIRVNEFDVMFNIHREPHPTQICNTSHAKRVIMKDLLPRKPENPTETKTNGNQDDARTDKDSKEKTEQNHPTDSTKRTDSPEQ